MWRLGYIALTRQKERKKERDVSAGYCTYKDEMRWMEMEMEM
jgi:hypothetical protein